MTSPVEAASSAAVAAAAPTSPDASTPSISLPGNEIESTRSGESSQSSKSDRRISFLGGDAPRRKSAQSSGSDSQAPESLVGNGGRQTPTLGRRMPSPPPPRRLSSYHRGVSFDTFDNRDASDFSFTLNYKHKNYQATRRGRTFLCGTDQNDYSEFALEWLIDELVDDGDEVICLRVVEKDSKIASDASVDEGRYRQEAENILKQVMEKNHHDEKAISLVLELAVGKVQEIIQRMIQIYEPAILIVGTRGRNLSGMQGLLPGSVSKYCLQQSPIPVVVVRPSTKREKKKQKRLADPNRRSYGNILQLSEQRGSGLFSSPQVKRDTNVSKQPDEEAAAVAEAVGLPRRFRHAHTGSDSKLSSAGSVDDDNIRTETPQPSPQEEDDDEEEEEDEEDITVNTRVLKSPGVSNFDTPPDSEDSDSDGEGGGGAILENNSTDSTTNLSSSSPKATAAAAATSITTDTDDTDTETVVPNKLQLADAS